MRKYLLGDLAAEERSRVEDEYFADSDRFEELVGIENDLIDSYVRGALSDSERRQFEEHYAKRPERRARIDFAIGLAHATVQEEEPVSLQKESLWASLCSIFRFPRPQFAWAFASGMVLLVGIALGLQNYRLRRELRDTQVNANESRRQQDILREQIARLSVQNKSEVGQGSEVAQLVLPDLTFRLGSHERGTAGQEDLVIPPNRPWVRLEMPVGRNVYPSYEAVLMQPEQDKAILRGRELQPQSIDGNVVVSWRLQADSIQSGDYIIRLIGKTAAGKLEELKAYSFRAVRH